MTYKLLIDECLWPGLTRDAEDAELWGSTCVRDRGWLGMRDEHLMPLVIEHDFTFVTMNARDFRGAGPEAPGGRYLDEPLHAGLVVLGAHERQPTVPEQKRLFAFAIERLKERPDLVNKVLEVWLMPGRAVDWVVYEHPAH